MKTTTTTTTDIKTALLNANGSKIQFHGKRWLLSCQEISAIYPYAHKSFHCTAEDLDPTTAEEASFCLWDLWKSDSEDTFKLLHKFAAIGGFTTTTN